MGLLEKVFGDWNEKEIKRLGKIADEVMALSDAMASLSDEALKAKTAEFKKRLTEGETLDGLLPEAFAVCREASFRVLHMKHFRVQVIGGIVLHEGNVAEMKTGEGKTLVATLPVYLNALSGKGVHVVTVNDYLARRDCEWMGQVYTWLGLSVGCVTHDVSGEERKAAYDADVTYGTNNEFGFDYLRDNMVVYKEQQLQRELNYAIVDEVDSILIDEARTPLIISGMGEKSTDLYKTADRFVRTLKKDIDFSMDEKDRTIALTEEGTTKCERYFGIENLSDPENMEINHHVIIALKAHHLMKRDSDYIETEGEIVIVDEFTGRLMYGRRYSDGLHQAIEAKEGIDVRAESRTLATITLQNYFRMYKKLAGMTGTAKTEEAEFSEIYNMQVVAIPTNEPVIRKDYDDLVYSSYRGKIHAVIEDVVKRHEKGQPILVGTVSVEKSELLSGYLTRRGIPHNVLNAKQHLREAEIVAEAGKKGAVTIATNMAGRGTDIILGGSDCTKEEHDEVVSLGGLHIIGTERHEARRIDNQLRGRSGRQGDPGSSQFFLALDDDLMRLFGGEKVRLLMNNMGLTEDEPIKAGILTKTIENAQKKVEGRNYGARRYVLQYDNVMNRQRSVIYAERNRVLHGENLKGHIVSMMKDVAEEIADFISAGSKFPEEWDFEALKRRVSDVSPYIKSPVFTEEEKQNLTKESLVGAIMAEFDKAYSAKEREIGEERIREVERMLLLRIVDAKWMDHIDAMDQLRTGIGLRSLGGIDPAQAYANEGGDMFDLMVRSICDDMLKYIFAVTIATNAERRRFITVGDARKDAVKSAAEEERNEREAPRQGGKRAAQGRNGRGYDINSKPEQGQTNAPQKRQPIHVDKKPGRNDPCPCGSGKKYKNCCGRNL